MAARAFVVGLSGVPGAGKSTLTKLLLQDFRQARAVYYDHHQSITRMSHAELCDWFGRGADPNEFPLSELVEELERQTLIGPGEHRAPLVLFETPFGRLHRATGAFIDLLVWVDTPLELALSRAILKFLVAAQSDQALNALPDFVRWQRQYLLNYEAVRPMYRAQQQALSLSADLTLDGSRPADESANLIGKALAQHNIRPS